MCNLSPSFKKHEICQTDHDISNYDVIVLTDLGRFFILDAYAGIYTVGDFIYLKDMMPLCLLNFAYRWFSTGNLQN